MTKIKKLEQAYATMTVAVYEPLIVGWISELELLHTSEAVAERGEGLKAKEIERQFEGSTAIENLVNVKPKLPHKVLEVENPEGSEPEGPPRPIDPPEPRIITPIMPTLSLADKVVVDQELSLVEMRNKVFLEVIDGLEKAEANQEPLEETIMKSVIKASDEGIFTYLPYGELNEALSPVGIAHFYRQLYFYANEGFGPLEQCFTVAPKEKLSVTVTSSRKQIQEELVEIGQESISEEAFEERNQQDVSDKVSSMLQRNTNLSMSATASYATPVWQAGVKASAAYSSSRQNAQSFAKKNLKEVTKKASERITKSYNIKTRSYDELIDTKETVHVIENMNDFPVNYGLRRIYNRIRVKVQDVGPKLVWQFFVKDPGRALRETKFVLFSEAQEVMMDLSLPVGLPKRPKGGIERDLTYHTAWKTLSEEKDKQLRKKIGKLPGIGDLYDLGVIEMEIRTTKDRKITAIEVGALRGAKDSEGTSASAFMEYKFGESISENGTLYKVSIPIKRGSSDSLEVSYSYYWEPSDASIKDWENMKKSAEDKLEAQAEAKARAEEFERSKQLITERSKVKARPANDLRLEERYEVINRMVEDVFTPPGTSRAPDPKEIEFFNRFFEIEAMFVKNHPSWWKPRFNRDNLKEKENQITADSSPSPLGSSLGWKIQIDGDARRNEFLNSPWVRVCIPIVAGREREALGWLSAHVEGKRGYDIKAGPLKELLTVIDDYRAKEEKVGRENQDYITVDSTVGAPDNALTPENVYPVIDEFEVTVPTEGFIFDQIKIHEDSLSSSLDERNRALSGSTR